MLTKQRQATLLTLIGKMSPEDLVFVHDKLHSKIDVIKERAAERARKHGAQRRRALVRYGTQDE